MNKSVTMSKRKTSFEGWGAAPELVLVAYAIDDLDDLKYELKNCRRLRHTNDMLEGLRNNLEGALRQLDIAQEKYANVEFETVETDA